MRALLWALRRAAALLLFAPAPVLAEAPAQGALLASEPCAPLPPHEKLDEFGRWYFAPAEWEEARSLPLDCRAIRYASDGVPVAGWILAPRGAAGRLPAILYARGGSGNFGRIDALTLAELRLLAREGYAVLATDYRFTGERARRDEFGGVDRRDVLHLAELARALPEVDPGRLFLHGVSRGGLMVYLALREGIGVRAASVIAGPTDLAAFARERPEFLEPTDDHDGWRQVWPDFERRADEHFRERSALAWAERLQAPLLILHARGDPKVAAHHALDLAARLQALGKEYELVVYGKDGHSLPLHRRDRNRHIVEWFRAHDPAGGRTP